MLAQLRDLEKIDLDSSPEQVAAQLGHMDNLCFIDSSGNFPRNYHRTISVIAAEADQIITGNISRPHSLKRVLSDYPPSSSSSLPNGGAIGWIDYDGDFTFGVYSSLLVFDHSTQQWWSNGDLATKLEPDIQQTPPSISSFSSNLSELDYITKVKQIKDYITAGDIYQVNLTQRFEAIINGPHLFPLYQILRESSPAPMATYIRLHGREILSSSPETFLKVDGSSIETRPIKGTRPRYKTPTEDLASAEELLTSEKEQAELIMITDLLRNDIGKVCAFGSVAVPELTQLEQLEHVYHLVSKIQGTLREGCDHVDAVQACYPGGSITGAPKIRAMEIIEELETVPRGLYTGAIGYFGLNQQTQLNIAIRTLSRENGKLHYHVGAGIVADSDPTAEYQETLQKAKGIRMALARYGCSS